MCDSGDAGLFPCGSFAGAGQTSAVALYRLYGGICRRFVDSPAAGGGIPMVAVPVGRPGRR